MIATFTALAFAHVLADFIFQTNWIAANKHRFPILLLHTAIVFATLFAATGSLDLIPLAALTAAHLVIDAIKVAMGKPHRVQVTGLWPFLADQAAHIATLIITAMLAPTLWANGHWAGHDWLLPLMAITTGLTLATIAGGYAVGFLMGPLAPPTLPSGLKQGGKVIGLLERGLVFLLVLVGQAGGIGFLIAAKSILRFNTTSANAGDDEANHQSASEYVIIGTLASFGWALAVSFGTMTWLDLLPPLGIPPASP